ncbi:uncharacterized protein [Physcomitrium patens]|uniref:uncharacterized protein isoform X3 n=1 Tax=Physcomitrium patens TaxID=3218 RepID=UPI000D16BEC0|nr:uncharacterized protein LOC112285173 isoform X3 [Physcomitrium patens]XP_024381557.1 uncharacterized protein LOC112285173 isoform X3 [Physcomitrium patens]|eukprot:XP_024381556.1 uncharacterized protein LOC112285173 isoform X3 [Physcomitrella patens]
MEYSKISTQLSNRLYGVELTNSQDLDQTDAEPKESQTLETQRRLSFWKMAWEGRPSWMRTVYSGKEALTGYCFILPILLTGDSTVMESVVNVATSFPFVLIGLRVPRKDFSTTMYSNSLIGVGLASTLYHTSRGEVRKSTRWGDYAMIATSTLCMSSALKNDNKNSRALMLASIMMLPFQPLLVTAIHTSLAEATFARKVIENPKLRGAHALHTASTLVGGALFVADDIYPDTPYIHAAWHVAAAVGVMTINTLID